MYKPINLYLFTINLFFFEIYIIVCTKYQNGYINMESEEYNLSHRIRFALKVLGVSQTDLAKKINVKPQIIQYLCAGNSEKSKFTFNIAEALNIDVGWLAIGKGIKPSLDNKEVPRTNNLIPVFSFKEIIEFKIEKSLIDASIIKNWIASNNSSEDSYGVVLNDKSMAPKFDSETIIIVEPLVELEINKLNNHFVLVYIAKENCVLFRQLIVENNICTLVPSNQTLYKPIILNSDDNILGICKEARWIV
jgi:transcriptional regulator with XRE-family HTH domain